MLLIEPVWNRNLVNHWEKGRLENLLIEPVWNRNDNWVNMSSVEKMNF